MLWGILSSIMIGNLAILCDWYSKLFPHCKCKHQDHHHVDEEEMLFVSWSKGFNVSHLYIYFYPTEAIVQRLLLHGVYLTCTMVYTSSHGNAFAIYPIDVFTLHPIDVEEVLET